MTTFIKPHPKIVLNCTVEVVLPVQVMSIGAWCGCLSNRPPRLLLCPPAGEGDAEDA